MKAQKVNVSLMSIRLMQTTRQVNIPNILSDSVSIANVLYLKLYVYNIVNKFSIYL